jgi:hypothetical protein
LGHSYNSASIGPSIIEVVLTVVQAGILTTTRPPPFLRHIAGYPGPAVPTPNCASLCSLLWFGSLICSPILSNEMDLSCPEKPRRVSFLMTNIHKEYQIRPPYANSPGIIRLFGSPTFSGCGVPPSIQRLWYVWLAALWHIYWRHCRKLRWPC